MSDPLYRRVGSPALLQEGKLPPQAPELEQALLGVLLLYPGRAKEMVGSAITSERMYVAAHQLILSAIEAILSRSAIPDTLTVVEELRKADKLDSAGGVFFISQLTNKVAGSASAEEWCRIITEKWVRRELIDLGASPMAWDESVDTFDLLDLWHQRLVKVGSVTTTSDGITASEVFRRIVDDNTESTFLSFGIPGLDEHASMGEGNVGIIGARPSVGKTTLMLVMARNLAMAGQHVGVISLEMTATQLVSKFVATLASVDAEKVVRNQLSPGERERMAKAWTEASAWLDRVHIDDPPSLHRSALPALMRRAKKRFNVSHLFIDYLQLFAGDGKDPYHEVTETSKAVKWATRETRMRTVLLSQLSRGRDASNPELRPTMAHLRDSGQIEADGDLIMLLGRDLRSDDPEEKRTLMVHIEKNKFGPTGRVGLYFDLSRQDIYKKSSLPVPSHPPVRIPHEPDEDAPF